MTRIDFYVLQNAGESSKDRLVCKLTEKAYQRGHQIYILTASDAETRHLDDLLWVFNPGAFIPHGLHLDHQGEKPLEIESLPVLSLPVLIGTSEPPQELHDVLVSLLPEVPNCFSRFQRLIEFVGDSDLEKQQSRQRFRFYRDRGYPLETHNL